MSLKKKITLTICIIVTILLVLLSLSIYMKSAFILNENAEEYMEAQILRAQEKIDLLVETIQLESIILARDNKVEQFLQNKISMDELNTYLTDKMARMNKDRNYYKDLFILNLDGYIKATTMPEAIELDLTNRKYILKCKETNETVTSDILHARSDSTMIVNTVSPIYDINGNVIALSGIAIKAEQFVNFIKDYKLGKSGYFVIIDSNNYILSHKNPAFIGKYVDETEYNIEKYEKSYDCLKTYKKMSSNNWILMANLPRKELNEKSISLLSYVILFGSIIIVISIFISIFISNSISAPIVSITNYINSMTNSNKYIDTTIDNTLKAFKENKSSDILIKNEDEIKNLNKSFLNLKKYFDKESQELIKTSKELTTSLQKKSYLTARFISTLSHDLRTSITLIKGYAKGLISGLITDEQVNKKFLKEIYDSAEYLEKITYDILDSTYEAQYSQKLHKEKINGKIYVEELFNKSRHYIENANRKFIGEFRCDDCFINIDPIKIRRVWNNLLSNAVKYTPEDNEIKVMLYTDNNKLIFKIIDTGIGIKKEDQDNIFDMFYTSSYKNKKSYGLGLFISKSIIEAHGENIKFKSEYGKGSVFYFEISIIS